MSENDGEKKMMRIQIYAEGAAPAAERGGQAREGGEGGRRGREAREGGEARLREGGRSWEGGGLCGRGEGLLKPARVGWWQASSTLLPSSGTG